MTEQRAWVLYLPLDVPSENQLLRGKTVQARNWRRRKWRTDAALVFKAMAAAHKIPKAAGKRRVTWERILGKGQKEYDDDNLRGGIKPILDGLRSVGLLVDDSPKHYEGRYGQVTDSRKDGPSLRVTIEEWTEEML